MTPSQVAAAKILLNKAMPDQKAIEVSGADGRALPTGVTINIVSPEEQSHSQLEQEQPLTITVEPEQEPDNDAIENQSDPAVS